MPTCHNQLIEELTSANLFSKFQTFTVQRRSPESGQVPQQTVMEIVGQIKKRLGFANYAIMTPD